jgi:Zn finger protein HypA/HybF involved in hydrogenase expression
MNTLPLKYPKCRWCTNQIMLEDEDEPGVFVCRVCLHHENPKEGQCYCPKCDAEREIQGKPPYAPR